MQIFTESYLLDKPVMIPKRMDLTSEITEQILDLGLAIERYEEDEYPGLGPECSGCPLDGDKFSMVESRRQPSIIIIDGEQIKQKEEKRKRYIEWLCQGVQLVFYPYSPSKEFIDHIGCHFCEESQHLVETLRHISSQYLNLTTKTRFFSRGKYRLQPGCVTILIATHKDLNVMGYTLKSIIRQTYDNYEVVIINDDPEPTSRSRLINLIENSFPELKSKLTVIHNLKNVFQYASMNIGLSYSTGEFITIIGTGDVILQNRLELIVQTFKNQPNKLLFRSLYVRTKGYNGDKVKTKGYHDREATSSCRRSLYEQAGFYDCVKCAADSIFLTLIPARYKTFVSKLSYVAVNSGMSNKYKTERVVYQQNCSEFVEKKAADDFTFNEPFLPQNHYVIPESIKSL